MWRPLKLSAQFRVSSFLAALCDFFCPSTFLVYSDLVLDENQTILEITRRSSYFSCGKTDLEILLFHRNRISCSGPASLCPYPSHSSPYFPLFLYFVFFSVCPSSFPLQSILCLSDGISNQNYQSFPFDWFSNSFLFSSPSFTANSKTCRFNLLPVFFLLSTSEEMCWQLCNITAMLIPGVWKLWYSIDFLLFLCHYRCLYPI